jgi:hypothetical protein
MSKNTGTKPPSSKSTPAPAKKPPASSRRSSTAEVKPISPVGLVGAIAAALVIAAILLFVINSRINAANQPATATGGATVVAGATNQAGQPAKSQSSGFTKGSASAKVVVDEYGDFK